VMHTLVHTNFADFEILKLSKGVSPQYGSQEARVMFCLPSCLVSMVLAWNMCSENICETKPVYLTLQSKYTFVLHSCLFSEGALIEHLL